MAEKADGDGKAVLECVMITSEFERILAVS